ncbi:hypothetical protein CEXT_620051 [Caerostris extrusa]|uniref:Uncharacterized protein n=1 Tax=Caerostris extrusa TaxID=172846 RepID=A0AAV4Y1W9_CAEEX|nr:hypothetical protein CEXT_620051 [Caerostris extrusa]
MSSRYCFHEKSRLFENKPLLVFHLADHLIWRKHPGETLAIASPLGSLTSTLLGVNLIWKMAADKRADLESHC